MASSNNDLQGVQYTAADVARLRNGARIPSSSLTTGGAVMRTKSVTETNRLWAAEKHAMRLKVLGFALVTIILAYLSLGIMGADGQNYPYCGAYRLYTPVEVWNALYEYAYNVVGEYTHWWGVHSNEWILANVPGYWAVQHRAGVVGITLICSVLLSVSGMLYQNAFKNPIAGPGMLGVGSGVSLGMMLMVVLYGEAATGMMAQRYLFCYSLGAAILLFVILAGRKLSGKDNPFDVVTMLLVGSIFSQLLGFIVSYVTLFVMDESDYLLFYTMSQMLVVDTSPISWAALCTAAVVALIPVFLLRYKLNILAFSASEARVLGLNYPLIRMIALVCGAIMILAAQVHMGAVSLISLIVPFLARSLFGCESHKQIIGNLCIGPLLLLICRDATDLIPFVVDGLAIGSVASVVMLPLFVVVMAKSMRGWE